MVPVNDELAAIGPECGSSDDIFSDLRTPPKNPAQPRRKRGILEDFDDYLRAELSEEERTPANPLLFWRSQGHRYPKLARVARSIFAIPASSAQVLNCLTCKAITVFPPSSHAIFLRLSGTSPRPGQPSQPKEATSSRPDWSSSSCLAVQARLR